MHLISCFFLPKLGVNPTSIDSAVVGTGNEVKMKPGQQLCIVNQLHPYTVQFKEDPTGNHGGTKRPRESVSEYRESQEEPRKMKATKQTEDVSVAVSHGETTKTSVRLKEWYGFINGILELIRAYKKKCVKSCRKPLDIGAKV